VNRRANLETTLYRDSMARGGITEGYCAPEAKIQFESVNPDHLAAKAYAGFAKPQFGDRAIGCSGQNHSIAESLDQPLPRL